MKRGTIGTSLSVLLLSGALYAAPGSAGTAGPSEAQRLVAAPGPVSQQAVKRTPGNLGDTSDLFVEGEVLVQFKKGVKRGVSSRVHAARGGMRVLDRIRGLGGRIEHVKLAPGLSVAQAVRRYEKDPNVAIAEPNFRYQLANHITPPITDTDYNHLWGLNNTGQPHNISDPPPAQASGTSGADIRAEAAWAEEHSSEAIVAVVDSGVDVDHEDLQNQLWENPAEVAGNPGEDDDGNGCIDDINGRAFGFPCANLTDVAPHGTHVAGTIAAEGQNATGVIGVCPNCKIMVLKFDLTTAGEVAAYAYARQKDADVINGSFGGPVWSKVAYNAIKLLNQAGIVAVYAAANDQLDNDLGLAHPDGSLSPAFPASYNLPNIISVAASNHRDQYGYHTGCNLPTSAGGGGIPKKFCSFSNVGRESVDLAAPGVDIRSTLPPDLPDHPAPHYDEFNGTSMAAPHVAGVAGLVRSKFPSLGPVGVKNKIMNGADKNLPTLSTFFSSILKGGKATGRFSRTSGRLNAQMALTAPITNATIKTDGDIPGAKRIARSRKGGVAYPNDVNDVYKKRLKKGKRYRAVLRVGRKDFDLWIWKPKTKQIWQFEPGCIFGGGRCPVVAAGFAPKGRNEVVTFKARKAGLHYFQVMAWLKMKGGYKLTIRRV